MMPIGCYNLLDPAYGKINLAWNSKRFNHFWACIKTQILYLELFAVLS